MNTTKTTELPSIESSTSVLPRGGHILLFTILTLGALVPIWIAPHFPSQNGPWYLLIVQMFKEFGNPTWDFAEYYQINWHPVPHMFHNLMVLGLSYVLPLLTAEKVALSVYVIAFPLSIFYFLSVVAPDRKELGYLSFLMIHTYSFYRGYHNFSISLPLFFTIFAIWLKHRDALSKKHLAIMAVLSLALYLAHLFVFAFLACCIGWYRLAEKRSFKAGVISALSATWPGWILFVDYFILTKTQSAWIKPEDTLFLLPHESIEYFVRKFFYTVSFPAYVLATLPWAWLVYLLIRRAMAVRSEGRSFWKEIADNPMLSLLVILLIGFFVVPYKFLAWHYVNLRMIPLILGVMIACAAVVPSLSRRVQTGILATVCLAALCIDGLLAREVVRMDAMLGDYLSGIEAYEGNTPLLPVNVENRAIGQVRPLTRAHEYYHIAKGGANGKGVAKVNTLVSMWYHEYPVSKMFPKYNSKAPEKSMPRICETYGYVLVYGKDDELYRQLDKNHFDLVHEKGKLRLYRNQRPVLAKSQSKQTSAE